MMGYNRTFRCNTFYSLIYKYEEDEDVQSINLGTKEACKKYIYSNLRRNQNYSLVEVKKGKNPIILNIWELKFTKEGPIFEKRTYSKLEELKRKANSITLTLWE